MGRDVPNNLTININGTPIEASSTVVLLGITIDKQLRFRAHIDNICRNAKYKIYALQRIRKYLTVTKARLLSNSFIQSQFNYYYFYYYCYYYLPRIASSVLIALLSLRVLIIFKAPI